MRAIILGVTAIAAVGLMPVAGHAQKSMKGQMDEMKTKDPQGFNACQTLAEQRGYRLSMPDYEGEAAAMFIYGCLMGRVR